MNKYIALLAASAVVIILLVLLRLVTGRRRLPYRRVESLLTAAERSFYDVLLRAVAPELVVFAKVRLADLMWLPDGVRDRQAHLGRIIAKHVDFVLCDRQTLSPVLAIELDDSSHLARERRDRDAFVDRALSAAGIPLLRVRAGRSYHLPELAGQLQEALQGSSRGAGLSG